MVPPQSLPPHVSVHSVPGGTRVLFSRKLAASSPGASATRALAAGAQVTTAAGVSAGNEAAKSGQGRAYVTLPASARRATASCCSAEHAPPDAYTYVTPAVTEAVGAMLRVGVSGGVPEADGVIERDADVDGVAVGDNDTTCVADGDVLTLPLQEGDRLTDAVAVGRGVAVTDTVASPEAARDADAVRDCDGDIDGGTD